MFQFQNGAIISFSRRALDVDPVFVSIPKWCDYKNHDRRFYQSTPTFQFQNGAIIRYRRDFADSGCGGVSIPKWCDYKRLRPDYQYNYNYVSIPKWCDYKC